MNPTFDYTTRDFVTIRRELGVRAARALPEWQDRDPSDFMNVLIELWAYMGDVMHFYIDRAAREAFLTTATQRESVLALANLYDYAPNPMVSARGTVELRNDSEVDVDIPAGLVLTATYNNITYYFYTTEAGVVPANSTASLAIREGSQYVDQSLVSTSTGLEVSDGTASQKFTLFHENVDLTTLDLKVQEGANAAPVTWRRVTRLVDLNATDSAYTATVLADGTTQITFGNGVNGRIPPTNIPITASYSVCSGAAGNLPANSLTSIDSPGYSGITVLSSSACWGGADAESVTSMKTSIPLAFRAQERAVTLTDFADLARGVPGVAKAVAVYSAGPSTGGSVTIYAVPYQSGYQSLAASVTFLPVDNSLREEIVTTVLPATMLGIGAISVPGAINLTSIYTYITLEVRDGFIQQKVVDAVTATISDYFSFDNVDFGKTLTVGDIYRRVLAVEGVLYAVITGFNTADVNSLLDSGKFAVQNNRLPRMGGVYITATGGMTE